MHISQLSVMLTKAQQENKSVVGQDQKSLLAIICADLSSKCPCVALAEKSRVDGCGDRVWLSQTRSENGSINNLIILFIIRIALE